MHGAAYYAQSGEWSRYYDVMAGAPARPTLLEALRRFEEDEASTNARCGNSEQAPHEFPHAIDLGCGEGRDTVELLRRGWRVLAIDVEAEAIARLRARPDLVHGDRLDTARAPYDRVTLPVCRLVNASYALPFCSPDAFPVLWRKIVDAIAPGGRFSGQLFGDRDDWAKLPERTHHTRSELDALVAEFILEQFQEEEHDSADALGYAKHWHLFHLVARKRV